MDKYHSEKMPKVFLSFLSSNVSAVFSLEHFDSDSGHQHQCSGPVTRNSQSPTPADFFMSIMLALLFRVAIRLTHLKRVVCAYNNILMKRFKPIGHSLKRLFAFLPAPLPTQALHLDLLVSDGSCFRYLSQLPCLETLQLTGLFKLQPKGLSCLQACLMPALKHFSMLGVCPTPNPQTSALKSRAGSCSAGTSSSSKAQTHSSSKGLSPAVLCARWG